MSSFDEISLVKEPRFSIKDYGCYINLFQKQAKKHKDNVYVRYEVVSVEGNIQVKTLTYGQVDLIITNLACEFYEKFAKKSVIFMLEDHSVYYLILLYTFYKLRVPVQMISTRNSSSAVCSLLNQVNSDCLLYGDSYQQIRNYTLKEIVDIESIPRPKLNLEELSKAPLNPNFEKILDQTFTEKDLKKTLNIGHRYILFLFVFILHNLSHVVNNKFIVLEQPIPRKLYIGVINLSCISFRHILKHFISVIYYSLLKMKMIS